ncbi:unnamed protein product [Darwinula stevensoni]|uniref:LRRCT domain-containing protein n=1 Tax=Darwinula stevensoni TaxID=69355 RepID=A0A7R9A2X0_9CRUS|nr:unnamed protein product [Darwinula stevensoni]CAG0889530.1 unnamed protein product [Darwinula stevensoni]
MWNMKSISILLVCILSSITGKEEKGWEWHPDCPEACTCRIAGLPDFPDFHRFDQAPEMPDGLKAATCILLNGVHFPGLFASLPNDTQTLTLLQSEDTGGLILNATHLGTLPQLLSLDIQGYGEMGDRHVSGHRNTTSRQHRNRSKSTPEFAIESDACKPLKKLQFLNLQFVKLLPDLTHHFTEPPFSTEKDEGLQKKRIGENLLPVKSNKVSSQTKRSEELQKMAYEIHEKLIVQTEPQILPYEEYLKAMERGKHTTFGNLTSLRYLRLSHVSLLQPNWEMFQGLVNLTYLALTHCSIAYLSPFLFFGAGNLTYLSLEDNQLLDLRMESLAGLLELDTLVLTDNKIAMFSDLSFPPMPKLKELYLEGNPIDMIFPGTFDVFTSIQKLELGGMPSKLHLLPYMFSGLKTLEHLTIPNAISDSLRPDIMNGLKNLKSLKIRGSVNSIEFDTFAQLPQLRDLDLSNCNISDMSMDSFMALSSLRTLNLSHNVIETLPPNLLDPMTLLRDIDLSHNQLTGTPNGTFDKVHPKMIKLDGNPWYCTCKMSSWRRRIITRSKSPIQEDCRTILGVKICTRKPIKYFHDPEVEPECAMPKELKGMKVSKALKMLKCDMDDHDDDLEENLSHKARKLQREIKLKKIHPKTHDFLHRGHDQP